MGPEAYLSFVSRAKGVPQGSGIETDLRYRRLLKHEV